MILFQKMDLVIISGWSRNPETNKLIEKLFAEKVPYTYVADGHHRTAAAALVGKEKRDNNPSHNGTEEYNFFLAVHFPADQLKIIDYNRTIKGPEWTDCRRNY